VSGLGLPEIWSSFLDAFPDLFDDVFKAANEAIVKDADRSAEFRSQVNFRRLP
jgi:hypothetical protein